MMHHPHNNQWLTLRSYLVCQQSLKQLSSKDSSFPAIPNLQFLHSVVLSFLFHPSIHKTKRSLKESCAETEPTSQTSWPIILVFSLISAQKDIYHVKVIVVHLFHQMSQHSSSPHQKQNDVTQHDVIRVDPCYFIQTLSYKRLISLAWATLVISCATNFDVAVKNLGLAVWWKQVFAVSNYIIKHVIDSFLPSQSMTHPQLMLIVYLQISAKVRPHMHFHLQRSVNRGQLSGSTSSFVIEFPLDLACL